MKKITLALGLASFAMTVAAAPHSNYHERDHWVGRHDYNTLDVPQVSVPDTASTLALAMIAAAALGITAISVNRKKA